MEQPNNAARAGVYIRTFGCQMNEYDTQKLYRLLEADYRPVSSPEEAKLVVINTCSVRDKPEQKLYSLLGEMQQLKLANPELLIGVGGCVAQQEGERIVRRSRAVDFVFGTHNLSLVPALIARRRSGSRPQVAVDYRDEWEELPLGFSEAALQGQLGHRPVSAFVSISRGCNKSCTYCIVPLTRGREVSRALDEILREVRLVVQRGVREVVLLGQTVNSYGLDLSPRLRFSDLLRELSAVSGLKRIRFTSPHPQEVRADFIELFSDNPLICRHIHLPVQSGSNRVLKLMNRNYRRERYLEIVAELRRRVPEIAITTDIIVGFPGESRQDFEQTLELMERCRFDNSYSFAFSPRPGTPAATMPEQLPGEEKLARLYELQAKQRELTDQALARAVGSELELLLDGPSAHNAECLQGRSSQNFTVNLNAAHPELKPGILVSARVSGAAKFTLKGDFLRILSD